MLRLMDFLEPSLSLASTISKDVIALFLPNFQVSFVDDADVGELGYLLEFILKNSNALPMKQLGNLLLICMLLKIHEGLPSHSEDLILKRVLPELLDRMENVGVAIPAEIKSYILKLQHHPLTSAMKEYVDRMTTPEEIVTLILRLQQSYTSEMTRHYSFSSVMEKYVMLWLIVQFHNPTNEGSDIRRNPNLEGFLLEGLDFQGPESFMIRKLALNITRQVISLKQPAIKVPENKFMWGEWSPLQWCKAWKTFFDHYEAIMMSDKPSMSDVGEFLDSNTTAFLGVPWCNRIIISGLSHKSVDVRISCLEALKNTPITTPYYDLVVYKMPKALDDDALYDGFSSTNMTCSFGSAVASFYRHYMLPGRSNSIRVLLDNIKDLTSDRAKLFLLRGIDMAPNK